MGEVVLIEDDSTQEFPLFLPPTPSPLQIITIKSSSIRETPGVITCNSNGCTSQGSSQGITLRELESWLPITESRNGSTFSAMFHLLCSGIGFQALLLPVAFAALGWWVYKLFNDFYPSLQTTIAYSLFFCYGNLLFDQLRYDSNMATSFVPKAVLFFKISKFQCRLRWTKE